MSLLIDGADKDPIHYPKRRNVFEFDSEVTQVFENMALRSIPVYMEMHKLHTDMLSDYIHGLPRRKTAFKVMDIGASTGVFYKYLSLQLMGNFRSPPGHNVECYALDNSEPMLDKLKENVPWVISENVDITKWEPKEGVYDCVNCTYVLQFIKDSDKLKLISNIYKSLVPGGLLFMGQKDQLTRVRNYSDPDEWLERNIDKQYVNFRMDNGYTKEEIAAKTEALRGSMWPLRHDKLLEMLSISNFRHVLETTRWLNFSSLVAMK